MPRRDDIRKVMIIGSGPIVIGQACEFDYSGTQACKALRSLGYEIVLANSNPATIMTDPGWPTSPTSSRSTRRGWPRSWKRSAPTPSFRTWAAVRAQPQLGARAVGVLSGSG